MVPLTVLGVSRVGGITNRGVVLVPLTGVWPECMGGIPLIEVWRLERWKLDGLVVPGAMVLWVWLELSEGWFVGVCGATL